MNVVTMISLMSKVLIIIVRLKLMLLILMMNIKTCPSSSSGYDRAKKIGQEIYWHPLFFYFLLIRLKTDQFINSAGFQYIDKVLIWVPKNAYLLRLVFANHKFRSIQRPAQGIPEGSSMQKIHSTLDGVRHSKCWIVKMQLYLHNCKIKDYF